MGLHTVCVVVTDDFLNFSRAVGNDLTTPVPEFSFNGLKAGDRWCLCALRWKEALENKTVKEVNAKEKKLKVSISEIIILKQK